jgi:hypothetical protein
MTPLTKSLPPAIKYAAGLSLLAAIGGIAFAAWADNGSNIFVAMIQSGMSWCF